MMREVANVNLSKEKLYAKPNMIAYDLLIKYDKI